MSWGQESGWGRGVGGAGRYLVEVDELRDGSHHLDGDLHHVLGRRHGSGSGSGGGTVTARHGSPPHRAAVPGRHRRLPASPEALTAATALDGGAGPSPEQARAGPLT